MKVVFSKRFIKQLAKTEPELAEEVYQAVEQFRSIKNHHTLKVHKLKGVLKDVYAFSVNYRVRVLFYYPEKGVAELVMFGTHDESYR